MCARFQLTVPKEQMEKLFDVELPEVEPRPNIAPTNHVLAIVAAGDHREAKYLRWGLVPPWADDLKIGQRMINARSETVLEKPAYRTAVRKRRCLIPASGFYEWSHNRLEAAAADVAREGQLALDMDLLEPPKAKNGKQAYLIHLKDAPVFAMAGLWERWESPQTGPIETCTVLTTEPNDLMAQLHNRMPCLLDEEGMALWLSDEKVESLMPLLAPFPSDRMLAEPTSVGPPGSDIVLR